MTSPILPASATVVVTGANGFVGSHVCAALADRSAAVRAVVRRAGTAPDLPEVEERVGDFTDPGFAAEVVAGADVLVTTVHPLAGDRETQREVGHHGTMSVARAAVDAGVPLLVHVSTASVYDRRPGVGDVDEHSALVPDDAGDYAVVKRDTDLDLARLEGPTRVLLRPPAILGPGRTSVWNTSRPEEICEEEPARHAVPDRSWAWVHVEDLAALAADVAVGAVPTADDPEAGPVAGGCTPVNVAGEPANWRDYLGTVTEAVGVEAVWDEGPAWTGRILADRARAWGWEPRIDLDRALRELRDGLRDGRRSGRD